MSYCDIGLHDRHPSGGFFSLLVPCRRKCHWSLRRHRGEISILTELFHLSLRWRRKKAVTLLSPPKNWVNFVTKQSDSAELKGGTPGELCVEENSGVGGILFIIALELAFYRCLSTRERGKDGAGLFQRRQARRGISKKIALPYEGKPGTQLEPE